MASETPRLDPTEIKDNSFPVFRLIGLVTSQPTESALTLKSPTKDGEMISLTNIRVSMNKQFEVDAWYEFVCRSSDNGDIGFLILDAVKCILEENETISIDGIVALQQLSKKFPEIY
ncbi:hypothetical protein TPHA_0E03380 [Tetrapisispora phaffii CBS 4417]|uniref:Replication factor A protein 3 n=1 Tax=Tetrapisispora phaffii (strain ATCC 24235 / CBS 4417 / NBRC 1672 / NRRL Y-8282 / UCD 70-5) TaxID=1071381 RepID=G8BU50_TETPH|nr:hypothetical protein TPHA_0E03380 [Tetrapisispora phaffii CBS 4417]CCE63428.1 hypothetical protein TPHA_0E03380 [Tetrapisispora phaffii CBS 4417]